ncbi:uncharacterized protein LOC144881008 isoform X1 [Branchiostoma floridae x Branchiostoma japonicum]
MDNTWAVVEWKVDNTFTAIPVTYIPDYDPKVGMAKYTKTLAKWEGDLLEATLIFTGKNIFYLHLAWKRLFPSIVMSSLPPATFNNRCNLICPGLTSMSNLMGPDGTFARSVFRDTTTRLIRCFAERCEKGKIKIIAIIVSGTKKAMEDLAAENSAITDKASKSSVPGSRKRTPSRKKMEADQSGAASSDDEPCPKKGKPKKNKEESSSKEGKGDKETKGKRKNGSPRENSGKGKNETAEEDKRRKKAQAESGIEATMSIIAEMAEDKGDEVVVVEPSQGSSKEPSTKNTKETSTKNTKETSTKNTKETSTKNTKETSTKNTKETSTKNTKETSTQTTASTNTKETSAKSPGAPLTAESIQDIVMGCLVPVLDALKGQDEKVENLGKNVDCMMNLLKRGKHPKIPSTASTEFTPPATTKHRLPSSSSALDTGFSGTLIKDAMEAVISGEFDFTSLGDVADLTSLGDKVDLSPPGDGDGGSLGDGVDLISLGGEVGFTSPMTQHHVSSPKDAGSHVSSPKDGSHVSSPMARHHVRSPMARHHVSSPKDGSHVSSPMARHHVRSPKDESHVSSPMAQHDVSSPKDGSHVSSPMARHDVSSPKDGSHVSSPMAQHDVSSPKDGSHVSSPMARHHVSSPKDGSHVSSPMAQHDVSSPKDGSHVSSPKDGSNVSSPMARHHVRSPKDGSHVSSPMARHHVRSPTNGSRVTSSTARLHVTSPTDGSRGGGVTPPRDGGVLNTQGGGGDPTSQAQVKKVAIGQVWRKVEIPELLNEILVGKSLKGAISSLMDALFTTDEMVHSSYEANERYKLKQLDHNRMAAMREHLATIKPDEVSRPDNPTFVRTLKKTVQNKCKSVRNQELEKEKARAMEKSASTSSATEN